MNNIIINNTKKQFIAHLEANNINYEEVNDKILFEFENHNLAAFGFWKKGFRLGIPFVFTTEDNVTNTDKDLVRLYLQETGKNGGVAFQGSVELNPDGTINTDEFIRVSNELSNTDVDIDKLRQESAELIAAFCGLFVELGKVVLSTSAAVLRGIADAIEPDDINRIDNFEGYNEN